MIDLKVNTTGRTAPGIMWKTVSEDCNLACDYCYYSTCQGKPGREIRRIEDELLQGVIGEMMTNSDGGVSFAWQGGEPLLAGLPFFERVVELQAKLAPPHTTISNSLQTNGTLIDAQWAAFFRKYSFLLGVSIDGPKSIHDKRRVTGSGAGTYERIMKGIIELRKARVDFNILTVIHEDNVTEGARLMSWLEENQFNHVQFIPCMDFRSQDADAEGRYLITPEAYGTFLCETFDSWYKGGHPVISVRFFDNWLLKLIGEEPESCIHREFCAGTLILEQNGDAYPCDFYIHDRYRLGNAGEQSMSELTGNSVFAEFAQLKGNLPVKCSACSYLHYCRGGCPRNRKVSMREDEESGRDYFCDSYRRLYAYGEERMRRLARRILAEQGHKRQLRNEPCLCGSGKKAKHCCN